MNAVFCDTSGLYALMYARDRYHRVATESWRGIRSKQLRVVTTNYVFSESAALIQRRHGLEKLRAFVDVLRRSIELHFIDAGIHDAAVAELLASGSRTLSFVDCSSFTFMRHGRIETYFGFDDDFIERGFTPVEGLN